MDHKMWDLLSNPRPVEKAPLLPQLEVKPTGIVSVFLSPSLSPGGSGLLTQPF